MLSLTDARRLLQDARSDDALRNCAFALGFSRATPVGRDLQEKLGIAGTAESFTVCEGRGILRALAVTTGSRTVIRDTLIAIANRLSSSVPHLLWIVFSTDGNSHVGISVWRRDTTRTRIYALLADPNRISDSDVQTLCSLASIVSTSDSLTHLRWTEILGREAITIRFFRALRAVIDGLADSMSPDTTPENSRALALTCVSRLLFLSFVERKGWLNGDHDFLSNSFIQCMTTGGRYHRKVLEPLFFGTLNTPLTRRAVHARNFGRIPFLNGGLFGRSALERKTRFELPDDAIGRVFGELLTRYRFTGHEESADLSESAIDPEILGRAFESLMHSQTRKSTGAFYTPGPVVQRVADAALEAAFRKLRVANSGIASLLCGVTVDGAESGHLLRRLSSLRILDPACGSGAFLVYLLEKIAGMRALCGDTRSAEARRREVLANTIFGVDINPTAVWLCELRLWLSVVVHTDATDPVRVMPLPNLDRNIRIGDSLAPRNRAIGYAPLCEDMRLTRLRYMSSVGTRKKLLGKALEKMERRHAISLLELGLEVVRSERNDLLAAARSRDLFGGRSSDRGVSARLAELRKLRTEKTRSLSTLRNGGALPFSFETQFADVMSAGGFDLVVGNPPWVRIHQISGSARAAFKREFELCRSTGWSAGAARAHAGRGFAHQLDLSALFVERSFGLLRPDGSMALLLPGKLWKSLAGGSVRTFVNKAGTIGVLEDFSAAKAMFDAATYPSLLVAAKNSETINGRRQPLQGIVHRRSGTFHWKMSAEMLPLDHSPGSPWLLVPREVRAAFDIIASRGIQMADSHFGRPLLGVKTGSNEVFIHHCLDDSGEIAQLGSPASPIEIESSLLRNVIRGDSVESWRVLPSSERIIWTHDADGDPLSNLPVLAESWFARRKRELARRTDARGDTRWWRVFRTESANSSMPRVIWPDIGRSPQAAVVSKNDTSVPLNTCYALPCESELDAHALAALINSPLIGAWLSLITEPAQGGYNRYMGWTMAMLPIPRKWDQCRIGLAKLSREAHTGTLPSASELFNKSLHAFGLREDDVQDLMIWTQQ